MKDHYATLGVQADASTRTIKAAYRRLIAKVHADRNPADVDRMRDIIEAHEVLADPELRRVYDSQRAGAHAELGEGEGGLLQTLRTDLGTFFRHVDGALNGAQQVGRAAEGAVTTAKKIVRRVRRKRSG